MNWGFNHIPEKLYNNAVKMTNLAKGFAGVGHASEIFYTIKSGNWNDASIWETVSGRSGKLPTANDDVYVKHTVAINVNVSLPSLYVSHLAVLTVNAGITLQINTRLSIASASLINKGTVNFNYPFDKSTVAGGTFDFITFTNTVGFIFSGDYTLPYTTYQSLLISGTGTKTPVGNISCGGTLKIDSINTTKSTLQLGTYDLSVTGITDIRPYGRLLKSSSGNILFGGALTFQSTPAFTSEFDVSAGNPTVELRGGISIIGGCPPLIFKTGTSQWNFTTNNQSISGGNVDLTFDCPVLITGAITVSLVNVGSFIIMRSYGLIDGTVAGSAFLLGNNHSTNRSSLYLYNSGTQMATAGSIDFTTNQDAIIGYLFNGNYTLPATTYQGLIIAGTGTKKVSGNLTVNQNLQIGLSSITESNFDLESYNLTVEKLTQIGATTGGVGTPCKLLKTGAGNVLFKGQLQYVAGGTVGNITMLDFSTGNPTVELRSGIAFFSNGFTEIRTGTGIWTFSTNNQAIQSGNTQYTFDCPVLISGAITLTHSFSSGTFSDITFNGTVDGNNANSVFDCRTIFRYRNAAAPMTTGKLYANQNTTNTFYYDAAFNQDIKVPDDPTTPGYRNLTLAGNGAKKLLGNVSVKGTYTLTSPATLDSNGFALTNP